MAYKVDFNAYGKMNDGTIGNVIQFSETAFTDLPIEEIETALNKKYSETKKQYVIDIKGINFLKGFTI